jgi:predicted DNA-binding transcriptional regulator YafY
MASPQPKDQAPLPAMKGSSWGQGRRLEFIEFRLLWQGKINRGELVDFFGTSIQQASLDLARYIELAPGNLEYDKSEKVYRATAKLHPVLIPQDSQSYLDQLSGSASGCLPSAPPFVGWRPPYDIVRHPTRSIQSEILIRVIWAIRDHEDLEISYQSMRNPAPVRRWIGPHAIAFDGSRWHSRAWCHQNHYFKDFVFARIQQVHDSRESNIDPSSDERWHSTATITLRAGRSLTVGQRRAVETEFGMQDGKLRITMRQALIPYFIRQLQLDDDRILPPRPQTIEWVNKKELTPLLLDAEKR